MGHCDAREGKLRGKMWMEWVTSSLALYVGTWSIQSLSADPHSSAASCRLNWHPSRFKWTRPFRWKTKSGFCACAITFRMCYTNVHQWILCLSRMWHGEQYFGRTVAPFSLKMNIHINMVQVLLGPDAHRPLIWAQCASLCLSLGKMLSKS